MAKDETIGLPGGSGERPATFFSGPEEFRRWLEVNHETADELWMGMYKKHVAKPGLTWKDAVPEALCFGWIDSVSQRIDDQVTRQRWTPRKRTSMWSVINIAHVERLIAEGRMWPAGLAAYANRREDRTGVYSHEAGDPELPDEYAVNLAANRSASAFWQVATPGYRKICIHWVLSAKQASTRDNRMAQLIENSANGQMIPSQRYGEIPKWVTRAAVAAEQAAAAPLE